MPFEGQHFAKQNEPVQVVQKQEPKVVHQTAQQTKAYIKPSEVVERKKFTQPQGSLLTANLGIKEILDPPKNKQAENQDALLPDLAENFSFEQLKNVWNAYALNLKREKKDSLYATLTGSELQVTSDFQISLEISNRAQIIDLEREKGSLISHLRSELRNYQISFSYKISEKQIVVTDSKSNFDTLAGENPSLHKLRKLFNLDIDY